MRFHLLEKGNHMTPNPTALLSSRTINRGLPIVFALSLAALSCLQGCTTNPTIELNPLSSITLPTPFGTLVFNFDKERQRVAGSTEQLAKQPDISKDPLRFRQYDFYTGPLPEGCQPFKAGRYGNFVFSNNEEVIANIRKKHEENKAKIDSPDEAAIALAIYDATAFRSRCGPLTMAKLMPGSRINGWLLNEEAVKLFEKAGQREVDVTPTITIVAINKKEFENHLKPTSANLLLSRFRFEIPPNADSLASDPKTGSIVLAYSMTLQDVMLGNDTHHVLSGGVMRIFIGKTHIYLIDFSADTDGIPENKWAAYQKYIDSFRYVGEVAGN